MKKIQSLFYRAQNFIIRKWFVIKRINTPENVVYITFDDGPERGVTEFILDELSKFNFKATFFCCGIAAAANTDLLERIVNEGHAIGNHTYNHVLAYRSSSFDYLKDVENADSILHTNLMRPPYGSLSISSFLKLRKKYKFIYWSLDSFDYLDDGNKEDYLNKLFENTKRGDIVLFHFCAKHEAQTRRILPLYLNWLEQNGFKSNKIFINNDQ